MPQAGSFQDFKFDATADETVANIKGCGQSGYIHFLEASNLDSSDYFLNLFNSPAACVCICNDVPAMSLLIPAGDGSQRGAMDKNLSVPFRFGCGMSYAVTTTAGAGACGPTTALPLAIGFS